METYLDNPNLKFIKKYCYNEESLSEFLKLLNKETFHNLYEAINNMYST